MKTNISVIFVDFRNEELPRDFRLQDDLFQMTTFTYNDIRAKTEDKLNLVRGPIHKWRYRFFPCPLSFLDPCYPIRPVRVKTYWASCLQSSGLMKVRLSWKHGGRSYLWGHVRPHSSTCYVQHFCTKVFSFSQFKICACNIMAKECIRWQLSMLIKCW